MGSNQYNECLTFKENENMCCLSEPHCIDGIVKQKTDGKIIDQTFYDVRVHFLS